VVVEDLPWESTPFFTTESQDVVGETELLFEAAGEQNDTEVIMSSQEKSEMEQMEAEVPKLKEDSSVWDLSWGPWYEKCSMFSGIWNNILMQVPEWPVGYSLGKDRRWLFFEGKTCVPSGLVPFVIRENHESQSTHIGVDRTILVWIDFICGRGEPG